jgi:hypothetical protein
VRRGVLRAVVGGGQQRKPARHRAERAPQEHQHRVRGRVRQQQLVEPVDLRGIAGTGGRIGQAQRGGQEVR